MENAISAVKCCTIVYSWNCCDCYWGHFESHLLVSVQPTSRSAILSYDKTCNFHVLFVMDLSSYYFLLPDHFFSYPSAFFPFFSKQMPPLAISVTEAWLNLIYHSSGQNNLFGDPSRASHNPSLGHVNAYQRETFSFRWVFETRHYIRLMDLLSCPWPTTLALLRKFMGNFLKQKQN